MRNRTVKAGIKILYSGTIRGNSFLSCLGVMSSLLHKITVSGRIPSSL